MKSSIWKAIFKFFILIPLLMVWGCEDANSDKETASTVSDSTGKDTSEESEKDFSFHLLKENISDAPIKTQVEQLVLVSGIPTKEDFEREILRRYEEINSRTGFRYHANPTNIYIYVFETEEQARAGAGLWIGMLAKSFYDSGTPKVTINEDRLADLSSPPEDKFGFSEEDRKIIFKEMADAEDRALKEARAKIPDSQFMEQFDLENDLARKYKKQVAKKYGLTADQLSEISLEGVIKGWPF